MTKKRGQRFEEIEMKYYIHQAHMDVILGAHTSIPFPKFLLIVF